MSKCTWRAKVLRVASGRRNKKVFCGELFLNSKFESFFCLYGWPEMNESAKWIILKLTSPYMLRRKIICLITKWAGRGTAMPRLITFCYYEVRRTLIPRKSDKVWASRRNTQKFNLLFKLSYFKKTLFLPPTHYCRLCNSAHTSQNMLMLPQK